MAVAAPPVRPVRAAGPSAAQAAVPAEAPTLEPFRWTRERYERAVDAGVFTSDDRLELIDGEVVVRMSQNTPHRTAVLLLGEALRAAFSPDAFVQEEKPVALLDMSEPEPDLAVVRGLIRDYTGGHPPADALLLVVEVADTSLARDRAVKEPLYAEAGVPEYWIVNLAERCVEVYREPSRRAFASKVTVREGDSVTPLLAPEASIPVADLLP